MATFDIQVGIDNEIDCIRFSNGASQIQFDNSECELVVLISDGENRFKISDVPKVIKSLQKTQVLKKGINLIPFFMD